MAGNLHSIAVWSPKGGVGKSVIAVALALKLAERQRTVLVDGNADNPDMVTLLQCPGHPNVTSWVTASDPGQVESMLVRHSQRLWILPGPPRYVEEGSLSGPVMESILDLCQRAKMTVVVDLGSALRDSTVAALDLVDRVLIPVTMDLMSVAPLRRLSRELDLLRLPESKFRVVVNRHTSSREITLDDIRAFSDFQIEGIIPSAKELAAAINRGEIGTALSGDSPVARSVAKLAEPFLDGGVTTPVDRKSGLGALIPVFRKGGS
ncbi:MAG TPA: P-loop NTPase [Symbiobacteriaceae bacterium]|nr:P-loop NTPase [Symbiobacteriaceae bacterium]